LKKRDEQHRREHHHPHDHDDGHHHHHPHDHHEHGASERADETPLERGHGAGKLLFFDAFSGIAGDMTIAALVDLGVPFSAISGAVGALELGGFHVHLGERHRSGIAARAFDVHVEADQPERTYGAIDAMLAESVLSAPVKGIARRIFRKLGEAEASVHGIALADVHFHEVGAVDAIVDVVGTAAALEWIGADEVVASPLPMGRGFVRARHGVLPLPAPAVVECLTGVPTYGVELDAELVTPTGAAIVASVAKRFERWPRFRPERVGWGAGARDLPDRPNLLRVVLGRPEEVAVADRATHVVLDANVDDMTGELAAHALATLLAEGALDAWATPTLMKKGRPALTLSALAVREQADAVAAVMLRETSSLGVRRSYVDRVERPRRMVEVSTPFGSVPVKISAGPFGPPRMKPEFDVCARLARDAGVTVGEVLDAALAAARAADHAE
jgi:uncharacterized protein (TIGR00299 family) protein